MKTYTEIEVAKLLINVLNKSDKALKHNIFCSMDISENEVHINEEVMTIPEFIKKGFEQFGADEEPNGWANDELLAGD